MMSNGFKVAKYFIFFLFADSSLSRKLKLYILSSLLSIVLQKN